MSAHPVETLEVAKVSNTKLKPSSRNAQVLQCRSPAKRFVSFCEHSITRT